MATKKNKTPTKKDSYIQGGYIRIYRRIIEKWRYFKNVKVFCLFIHLLLHANYIESKQFGRIIKRGQLATNPNELSEITGLIEDDVNDALICLKENKDIKIKLINQMLIITIIN